MTTTSWRSVLVTARRSARLPTSWSVLVAAAFLLPLDLARLSALYLVGLCVSLACRSIVYTAGEKQDANE